MRPLFRLIVLAQAVFTIAAPASQPTSSLPDAKAIDAIVEELASGDFQARESATEKLQQYGPEILPLLQPYLKDENPEVRARVAGIIRSFEWMKRGAIIVAVQPGSPAQQLGMAVGDVIVKFGNVPVAGYAEFIKAREGAAAPVTFYLWRSGRVVKIDSVPAGLLGVTMANWDLAKGGSEQATGLAALAGPPRNFDAAYQHLRAAKERGLEDGYTYDVLAAVAARSLDRELSEAAFRANLAGQASCNRSHLPPAEPFISLPYEPPRTQWLLERYGKGPYSSQLAHEMEDWFSLRAANESLLKELLAKAPADPWRGGSFQYHHEVAAMRLALTERRYDDVLAIWKANPEANNGGTAYGNRQIMTLQAMLRAGLSEDAATLSLEMLTPDLVNDQAEPEMALWGFTLAAAIDDRNTMNRYLRRLSNFAEKDLQKVAELTSAASLYQPAAAAALRDWLAAQPPRAERTLLDDIALASLIADPATTVEKFNAAIESCKPTPATLRLNLTLATGYLRFGDAVKAGEMIALDSRAHPKQTLSIARQLNEAAKFAEEHKAELADAWKELQGMIQVVHSKGDESTWVLRYDGEVFRIDKAGTAKKFPGLAPPPAPVNVAFEHLLPRPNGVVVLYPYGRTNPLVSPRGLFDVAYQFDEKKQAWIAPADWDGPQEHDPRAAVLKARCARYVEQNYPPLKGPLPRNGGGVSSRMVWLEPNILIYIDPRTNEPKDLPRAIAKLAGKEQPAQVYFPSRPNGGWMVLSSDCGAWAFNTADGELRRLKLGLPDGKEDVIACQLPEDLYGVRRDGKILVGVAPQQGGQVFLVDAKAGTSELTKGYCGFGPRDWLGHQAQAWHWDDPQEGFYAAYVARVGKKSD